METINNDNEKAFDAIATMRRIRNEVSLEIMDMTYEEERSYLNDLVAANKKSEDR